MAWENPITNWGSQGQTSPGVDDFNRMEGNIDILGKYDRAPGYGTATGTNTKTITLNPAPGSYYDGLCFAFKNITENTGAVTINVNGLGAKAVKKPNGNDVAAGNLKAGSIYTVRYNGTNFILQGSDSSGNATPEHVLAGKTFSNDNDTGITGTMPNRGAINEIITVQGGQIIIPEGYHNGNGIVKANFANLVAGNIKSGVNIGGVVGNMAVARQYAVPSYTMREEEYFSSSPVNSYRSKKVRYFIGGSARYRFRIYANFVSGYGGTITGDYIITVNGITKKQATINQYFDGTGDNPPVYSGSTDARNEDISFQANDVIEAKIRWTGDTNRITSARVYIGFGYDCAANVLIEDDFVVL